MAGANKLEKKPNTKQITPITQQKTTADNKTTNTNTALVSLDKKDINNLLMQKTNIEEIDKKLAFMRLNKPNDMFYVFYTRGQIEFDITKKFAMNLMGWLTGYSVKETKFKTTDDGYVIATTILEDTYLDTQSIGVAEEPLMKEWGKNGELIPDKFARRKAAAKSLRNAIRDILPPSIMQSLRDLFEEWMNSLPKKEINKLIGKRY